MMNRAAALLLSVACVSCANDVDTDVLDDHAHEGDYDPEDPFAPFDADGMSYEEEQALNTATCDSNASTGDYCGSDKVSNGRRHTLYRCNGPGPATVRQVCESDCVIAPPGVDDYCRNVTPTCDDDARTGAYCGGDKVSNAVASTLYRCNGPGRATVISQCGNGCVVAPPGSDDYCRNLSPTCDGDARTGEYCGGDKVSHGSSSTLYHCNGPGRAVVVQDCQSGCTVAPPGVDDFCRSGSSGGGGSVGGDCPRRPLLKWGLAPRASDGLRCSGIGAASVMQTIGNASASAGTHGQDGTIDGHAYSAATDLSTRGLTNAEVRGLLNRLADHGFAAFFRDPGRDGWPSSEVRHIHAIYVGARMKASLRAQVSDWLNGKNGLASHTNYTFWQASSAQKDRVRQLFNAHN